MDVARDLAEHLQRVGLRPTDHPRQVGTQRVDHQIRHSGWNRIGFQSSTALVRPGDRLRSRTAVPTVVHNQRLDRQIQTRKLVGLGERVDDDDRRVVPGSAAHLRQRLANAQDGDLVVAATAIYRNRRVPQVAVSAGVDRQEIITSTQLDLNESQCAEADVRGGHVSDHTAVGGSGIFQGTRSRRRKCLGDRRSVNRQPIEHHAVTGDRPRDRQRR